MTFADCAPVFQDHIRELSQRHHKSVETIYQWWREYCNDCRNGDMSPVLSEFDQWYAERLAS